MFVYCYHIIITICYKVSKIQEKKNSKVSDYSSIGWLSRHVVYNFMYE